MILKSTSLLFAAIILYEALNHIRYLSTTTVGNDDVLVVLTKILVAGVLAILALK